MATLYDLIKFSTATTGAGTITVGSAVAPFATPVAAGIPDGVTVDYSINDGNNSEKGRGLIGGGGTTLTRSVLVAYVSNVKQATPISLSGSAVVFIDPAAESLREMLVANRTYYVATTGNDNNTGLAGASATITFTNGSSNVGWTSHGLSVGNVVVPTTNGTLPTGFTAGMPYYVKTVVDANTITVALTSSGTAITAGSAGSGTQTGTKTNPKATIQNSVSTISSTLDLGGFNCTIQLAGGTYNESVNLEPYIGRAAQGHTGPVIIQGITSDATQVTVNGSTCFQAVETSGLEWVLKSLTLTASDKGVLADVNGWIVCDGLIFGACTNQHALAENGGTVEFISNYTISGSSALHLYAVQRGMILYTGGQTITVSGTPAFSAFFADADRLGLISAPSVTYSGSATGTRYNVSLNGVIYTNGGGANYFPGNAAGSTATGGQYG